LNYAGARFYTGGIIRFLSLPFSSETLKGTLRMKIFILMLMSGCAVLGQMAPTNKTTVPAAVYQRYTNANWQISVLISENLKLRNERSQWTKLIEEKKKAKKLILPDETKTVADTESKMRANNKRIAALRLDLTEMETKYPALRPKTKEPSPREIQERRQRHPSY
jgi:hypothetical protein